MNQHRLPSDIVGLTKVMPPLSRRGFMSSSAAAAAGYTLAAGPVRADVIHTDTKGLNARTASVAVQGGNMPVYFARPSDMANPPVHAAPKNSIDLAPEVKEPVLGLYGEADAGIPPDQVHQMEAALKAAGKTAEFHEYPGAPHGFVADYRASYRQEAAEDGWNRMVGWFKKYKVLS